LLHWRKRIAKTKRQLTKQDADEIGIELYEQLCTWAVQEGHREVIFVWAFMTAQWNVMGRTVNVDPLGFHNLKSHSMTAS
jgi:hypothetical protein